jgi:hypothetical protein
VSSTAPKPITREQAIELEQMWREVILERVTAKIEGNLYETRSGPIERNLRNWSIENLGRTFGSNLELWIEAQFLIQGLELNRV